ncbi:MAG: hypothetical protein ACQES7_04330 [Pseudomonadota bacterium]
MPTTTVTLSPEDGWTKVADDGAEFMLQASNYPVCVAFGSVMPAANAAYHLVYKNELLVRSCPGALYAKSGSASKATIVVSV